MENEYSKISPTAVFCARMRAKQDLPFAKKIIELIDNKYSNSAEDLPDYGDTLKTKSNFIPFIEGRYHSLNDVLERRENIFVVELASGLSPRSLQFLNRKDVLYIETELEGLIKLKEQILKDIIREGGLKESNLSFISVNPLDRSDMDKLGKLYQEKGENKRLIVIHEGLLMYFNKEEKKKFRDNIKYLFENYSKTGLWLTSDLSRMKKKEDAPKGKENIRDKISLVTKREFDYFESEEETGKFLEEGDFKFKTINNKKIMERVIEKKNLQSNKEDILDSSKGYRIWEMQLT